MLHEIQEEGDDGGVDDIDKHRADDRYDEEGFDGIAVFIADDICTILLIMRCYVAAIGVVDFCSGWAQEAILH